MYTYSSAFLFGLPLLLLLHRYCWLRWWQCTVAGVLASIPFLAVLGGFLLYPAMLESQEGALSAIQLSGLILGVGAISGFAFWLVALTPNQRFQRTRYGGLRPHPRAAEPRR